MKKNNQNFKLGGFVLAGTALLVVALYLIGAKQNLFSKTFTVNALFHNVNGLMAGNNVRFAGINVGTVKKVNIVNDTTVIVEMIVETDAKKFIRINSVADIGSDGLMGNKLINISTPSTTGENVNDGDTIPSLVAVATDDMMRTLSQTNNNVLDITSDLKVTTKRINESNSLWSLLADSAIADQVHTTLTNLQRTTEHANNFSGDLESMMNDIQAGKGVAGQLFYDDSTALELKKTIINLQQATDTAKLALHHMHEFMKDLNITPGPLGVLARDTAMANDLKGTIHTLKTSSASLDENMKALQKNFLFRRYFKNKKKEDAKKANQDTTGNTP